MMNNLFKTALISVIIVLLMFGSLISQERNLLIPPDLKEAYYKGTRSLNGHPGENYWQNRADYNLSVEFDPTTRKLSGTGIITYTNNSPDNLDQLLIMLFADLYKQGNPRDFRVNGEDEHPGVIIREMKVNGQLINTDRKKSNEMFYGATSALLYLPKPLPAGSSLELEIAWEYTVNRGSHMRTGQVDESSFFLAYWFPRIGVYDDVTGWNDYTYTGVGEFYNDFGDFNVKITVPSNFMVWATGELQNPDAVYPDHIFERYNTARQSTEIVAIIDKSDLRNPPKHDNSKKVWNYKAVNVTDFAFALSDHYLWDGLTLPAGKDQSPVFISVAYDPSSNDFYHVADMAANVIDYMTTKLPGLPFPYPTITVFNGLDEMEYPMIVNNMSYGDLDETFKLTAHEIGHSYFPFLTGCNEKKYAWMDEGLTSLFEYCQTRDLLDSSKAYVYFTKKYLEIKGSARDIPLVTSSDLVRAPEYYAIFYVKAVFFYSVVMAQVGEEVFREIIDEFVNRWSGKHPTGYDLIFTINDVVGEDLNWLFRPWLFEFGVVDLGIASARETNEGFSVEVVNKGSLPAPIRLLATFNNGRTELINRPSELWKDGNKSVTIDYSTNLKIKQITLVQKFPIDINPKNDSYKF